MAAWPPTPENLMWLIELWAGTWKEMQPDLREGLNEAMKTENENIVRYVWPPETMHCDSYEFDLDAMTCHDTNMCF